MIMGGFGGVAVTGGNRDFLWMTVDGKLVIHDKDGRFKTVSLYDLLESVSDHEYELLEFWLSNDSQGALELIERNLNERINELLEYC